MELPTLALKYLGYGLWAVAYEKRETAYTLHLTKNSSSIICFYVYWCKKWKKLNEPDAVMHTKLVCNGSISDINFI